MADQNAPNESSLFNAPFLFELDDQISNHNPSKDGLFSEIDARSDGQSDSYCNNIESNILSIIDHEASEISEFDVLD